MIVCPNCNHQNPDGAIQCEACYTPLPATTTCPTCGATVQADASFCGQCGYNLRGAVVAVPAAMQLGVDPFPKNVSSSEMAASEPMPGAVAIAGQARSASQGQPSQNFPVSVPSAQPAAFQEIRTQLQQHSAQLLHTQTGTLLELPPHLTVIHLGKPNDRIPPDVDVSGFPDSEIVSRIHADIRLEGDAFYIEDVGSANGTYVNNIPLPMGNRHRLRSGDRIALGKGDKVTFVFQLS